MISIKQLLFQRKIYLSKKEWLIIIAIILMCTGRLIAQESRVVKGTIISKIDGETLPGVNVLIKGSNKGVISDFNGKYSINASSENVLVFSYIGFKNFEVLIENKSVIDISLQLDTESLDEVVVVGYGTQRKSDLTGSVSVVDVSDAKKTESYDVSKMLQGQVAGVTVQSSGEPGGFVNIKIRGVNSFTNNNPLFVIDGMIIDSPYDFAPGDIESMQVLKDASSAAIYGVRGANGVIIITTKKGKAGKMGVTYKSLIGFQNVTNKYSLTNREEYQQVTNAALINSGATIFPGNDSSTEYFIDDVDTDWQDAAFDTGIVENHSLTFSGGAEKLNFNLNMDYFNNSSYMDTPQDYERLSTTLNIGGTQGKFKYGAKLGYTQSNKEAFNEYNAGTSAIIPLLQAIPTMPVYDENRLGGYGGTDNLTQRSISLNVIGFNNLIENQNTRNRFIGNFWGQYEIIKGLKYKISVSGDRLDWRTRYYVPPSDLGWYYITTNDESSLDVTGGNLTKTIIDNILTYNFEVEKHKFDVLLGMVQENTDYYNHWSRGVGFEDGEIAHLEYAEDTSTGEYESKVTSLSYLSRINYSYDDKYLITANFRRDKSSLFPEKNNTGDYYSFSGAWKIHNESFIHLPEWISTMKLRGGYGILGNNAIGVYSYTATVNSFASYVFGDTLASGTTSVSVKDPDIKWEDTKTSNVALEMGMFDNKLQFTAEYYIKTSTDLLAEVPIPYSSGAYPITLQTNAGSLENQGFEFTLGYHNDYSKKFKYSISANLGTLKNKVLSIGSDDTPIYGSASKTEVGRSVGELYVYEMEGIYQNQGDLDSHATQTLAEVGDVMFKDQINVDTDGDGIADASDGIINDDDRVYKGVTIPKYSYGINFSSSYNNFDFSLFLQGSGGNKVFNATYRALMIGDIVNHHTDILDYWTPTNTDTNIPRVIVGDPNANSRDSDRFVEDGDFLKLQNVQLGYNIPIDNSKYFSSARIYVSGQNVATFTKYKGYDPDFNNGGLFSRGYDLGSFPNPRTFSLGVQVDF